MSSEFAPPLTYHYWLLGINNPDMSEDADPLVLIKGTEFEPEKEIETADDEGHTGTATTKMATYRTKAYSNPKFTDKTRYKEGWEDIWFLLLGSADINTGDVRKTAKVDEATVFDYTFAVNSAQPQNPYFCTLYNGFAKTEHDAYKYQDCLLNEFELKFSNEDAMTYTATFAANFPKFNQTNPARVMPRKTVFTKSSEVSVYIAPFREIGYTTLDQMKQYGHKYGCYIEGGISVKNNAETQPCSSDEFGTATKVLGNREAEFNLTLPWTDSTKKLEYIYMGGSENSTTVTSDNDVKTVWIVCESENIGETDYRYTTIIKIPEINLTLANSAQSGSDSKQLELEGTIMENGTDSFIETIITTDLEDLHIQQEAEPPATGS